MARNVYNLDYFEEALACIKHVHELTTAATGDRRELHPQQCQYLSSKVSETGLFLRARAESLRDISGVDDIRRKALRHLHFTVKRAETLVRGCLCEFEPSWLEAAVTLPDIKEDIVDILLDLQWWTSMVGIAMASITSVAGGQNNELELVTAAEEDLERLMVQFLPGQPGVESVNELDNAVAIDKEELLQRVREVQSRYANIEHDHEYLFARHVRSRLEDIDVTQSMKDVELNAYEPALRPIIGFGSFAVVLKVRWLGRYCALKQLHDIRAEEAMSLSLFQHPHIVQFFRYWEDPRGSCATTPVTSDSEPEQTSFASKSHILMELLPEDLAEHMKRGSSQNAQAPLSQDVAIDVMLQLAKAMWHLNNMNVVHRNLKPHNVLVKPVSPEDSPELGERGYVRVKLGDFGLAKTNILGSLCSSQSKNVGSRFYGAPEVFNKEYSGRRFPRKADVWSYGMMFSEVLTGEPPFKEYEYERFALNEKIKDGTRPELPRECPGYLKFIIEQCWSYKQEDRPSFMDLWKMVRFAQVRSLGIIREDHQLFSFTTREGLEQQLHKVPWSGDYFQEVLSCIQRVLGFTSRATKNSNQLHHRQCQYLSCKVRQTGDFLQTRAGKLQGIAGVDDIRRKALQYLHFTVKRAEMLVRSCSCVFETSWLEAAVTLNDIKEDIVDIQLDLQWWTSMVGIAIAMVGIEEIDMVRIEEIERGLVTAAEKDLEELMGQLLSGAQELDTAAAIDKEELLKRVREVESRYANTAHDHDYLLASHVRTRLEGIDVTQSMTNVELNTYDVRGLLGFGYFSAVMKVKWLGRDCALKQLSNTCPKEAMTLSAFQHPHIVQFFRYWEAPFSRPRDSSGATTPVILDAASNSVSLSSNTEQGTFQSKSHILMELLPLDLAQHMTQPMGKVSQKRSATGSLPDVQAPLSQDVAIDVMLQLAKAMWHLNSKDVAHRDLKPSNVLVQPVSSDHTPELAESGYVRVKLGDFGLAKTEAFSTAISTQTRNLGTKNYGAPEVLNEDTISKKQFPRKADVWSYGMIFNELLGGKPPFKGIPMKRLINEVTRGTRPELPKVLPEYLKFIIEHCWKYKQEDRPNFQDLWKMVRFAQVRSLCLIRHDHQLFTFTTRKGVVQRLQRSPPTGKDLTKPSLFSGILGRLKLLFTPSPSMARLDDKPLGYTVNEVGSPEAGASTTKTLDVIFFEGNVGERKFLSCKDTWVQRGKPNVWWPRDWLVKDFKGEIRVLVLQYDISDNGVESVVDDLQRYLVFSDLWNRKEKWDRPIVLVGHSLGCVVIEKLVVALNQKATSIDSVRDEFDINRANLAKAFLASLAGCFFYAPPYTGLAPHESLLKQIFGGLTYSSELFAELCLDSSKLQKLSEQFMLARSERVQLMALIEGSHTRGETVVPPSLMQELKGEVEVLGDSDHSNTCKPINKDHPAYRRLFDFIRAIQNEGR